MKSAKSKRQFTLLTLVVALGVAVYLNWEYAKTDAPFALQDPGAVSANAAVETVTDGTTSGVLDALPVQEALPDKNYGDAQLVSANETSNDKYFEQARLTRSKTRDEALDTMQQALKMPSCPRLKRQRSPKRSPTPSTASQWKATSKTW